MYSTTKYLLLILTILLVVSCIGQNKPQVHNSTTVQQKPETDTLKIPLPENGFYCGYSDKLGNLWFGTNGSGIFQFDGKSFTQFTQKDGLISNQVYAITADHNNSIWIGTNKGLVKYEDHTFSHIPIPQQDTSSQWLDQVYPIINPNAVHAIIQDQKGDFWIGTGGGGAYHYDQEQFTSILAEQGAKYEDSLYHNWIPDIAEDLNGNIWFASMSYGGLNQFDGKSFKKYLRKDGLSDDMIRDIYVGSDGKIWLGFNGNRKSALTVYNNGSFYTYSLDENACHKNIRSILEDKDKKLWLGGAAGICNLHQDHFTEFLNTDGSPFSGITFIVEDLNHHIWFGGRKGLWKYDGAKITQLTK